MERNESNKLIAEFMGCFFKDDFWIVTVNGQEIPTVRNSLDMQYHSNWSWLMPVVEKIESLGYWVVMMPNGCQIYKASGNFYGDMVIDADFKNTRLENTYEAVVCFIENNYPIIPQP
jgi:hypothetical protein